MNVTAGSIQHEETKCLPEERQARSLRGGRAHLSWHCTQSCWWYTSGVLTPLSWGSENKGRKIRTLGDSTQTLPGRS